MKEHTSNNTIQKKLNLKYLIRPTRAPEGIVTNETITNKIKIEKTLITSPMPSDSTSAAFDKARGIKYCPELNSDAACTPKIER